MRQGDGWLKVESHHLPVPIRLSRFGKENVSEECTAQERRESNKITTMAK